MPDVQHASQRRARSAGARGSCEPPRSPCCLRTWTNRVRAAATRARAARSASDAPGPTRLGAEGRATRPAEATHRFYGRCHRVRGWKGPAESRRRRPAVEPQHRVTSPPEARRRTGSPLSLADRDALRSTCAPRGAPARRRGPLRTAACATAALGPLFASCWSLRSFAAVSFVVSFSCLELAPAGWECSAAGGRLWVAAVGDRGRQRAPSSGISRWCVGHSRVEFRRPVLVSSSTGQSAGAVLYTGGCSGDAGCSLLSSAAVCLAAIPLTEMVRALRHHSPRSPDA